MCKEAWIERYETAILDWIEENDYEGDPFKLPKEAEQYAAEMADNDI